MDGCNSRTDSRLAFLILTALAMLSGSNALADGIIRDGIGARSTGRGGTNIGFADNGNIIADNPGALVNVSGQGLYEIGLDIFTTDLDYTDPDNLWASSSDNPFPMGQLSVIRKSADGNIAYGIGVFSQAGFSTRYTLNGPVPFAGPQTYKSIGALLRILPSLSVALTDRLSVGATLGAGVSHLELEGPYFTQAPTPFRGTPLLLDLQATGVGASWSIGAQYQLTCDTTIGISYQSETQISSSGSATLNIPGLGFSAYDMRLENTWPSTLGIGIAHRLNSKTTVASDVIWTNWSDAKDSYDMLFTNPSNPVHAAVLGPAVPEVFPLNWRDSVSLRLGVERQIGCNQVVRAGYVYHRNPIPASTLTPFIQAHIEHSISAGYGWKRGNYEFDLGYQAMLGPDVNVGTSTFVGGDFDGATSTASAHWVMGSIIRRF